MSIFQIGKTKISIQSSLVKKLKKSAALLLEAINYENKTLENGDISNFKKISDKKFKALQEFGDFHLKLEEFVKIEKIDKSDPALPALKEIFLEIEEANIKNKILLQANIEINNRIIELYKEFQKEEITKNYGYNDQGKMVTFKSLEKVVPSMSLNNKI